MRTVAVSIVLVIVAALLFGACGGETATTTTGAGTVTTSGATTVSTLAVTPELTTYAGEMEAFLQSFAAAIAQVQSIELSGASSGYAVEDAQKIQAAVTEVHKAVDVLYGVAAPAVVAEQHNKLLLSVDELVRALDDYALAARNNSKADAAVALGRMEPAGSAMAGAVRDLTALLGGAAPAQ